MKLKYIDKIIIISFFIVLVTIILIKCFSKISDKILNDYIELNIRNNISNIVNGSIKNVLYSNSYDNLIISSNNSNKVSYLDFDNTKINKLNYEITNDILNSISVIENSNQGIYYIPIGVLYNTTILNYLGPKVPFKIELIGSINNETSINVKEYGINSSLVELLLNIEINMQVIMPFRSKRITVNKSIILDSKIIQAEVPNYYGGIMSVH